MNTTILLRKYVEIRLGPVFGLLHNSLAVLGLAALLVLVVQGESYPTPVPSGANAPAFGTIRYEGISLFEPADPDNPKYQAIESYLSRRYRVASDATEQLVSGAFDAGRQVGVDPLLILAVMAVESRFNPIAESVRGAKGLMQVIPRFHQDKLGEHGGADSVLHPMTNILVGATILKEYTRRARSLKAGLQLYSGGLSDTSGQYAQKVMGEMGRLRQTIYRYERAPRKDATARGWSGMTFADAGAAADLTLT